MSNLDSEFDAGHGTYQLSRNGLAERVGDGWRNMRASTRRLLRENPSEGRLLFYVLVSDMVFFISWSLKTLVAPASIAGGLLSPDHVGLLMVAALMLRTALMYVFSAVVFGVTRTAGGAASFRDTRAAVFWGAFVSAPFGLFAALIACILASWEPSFPALANPLLQLPVYWLGLIPFVYYISAGLAEANGFRMTAPTFMVLSAFALGLTIVALVYGFGDAIG